MAIFGELGKIGNFLRTWYGGLDGFWPNTVLIGAVACFAILTLLLLVIGVRWLKRRARAKSTEANSVPGPVARPAGPADNVTEAKTENIREAIRRAQVCAERGDEELDLSGLQLKEIPAALLALITESKLGNVKVLSLAFNGIGPEGAAHLRELIGLTSLDLNGNRIGSEGAAQLKGLVGLQHLSLSSNGIGPEGAMHLRRLIGLTSLDLAFNEIGPEGAAHLKGLIGLQHLNLKDNNIGPEGAAHLKTLIGLTSLNLWDNGIGPEGAAHLKPLFGLTSLDLGFNEIGPDGAAHLKGLVGLQHLSLSSNGIGPEGAMHLRRLIGLTSLDLGFNEIGPDGAAHLKTLIGLTSLELGGNHIGPEGAAHLRGLIGLQHLDLAFSYIGSEGVAHLKPLIGLQYLDLRVNRIGPEGAAHLRGLISLMSLDLEGNRIGPEGAAHLKTLIGLTSLDLEGNGIGPEGAAHLKPLIGLTSLNLDRNGDVSLNALAELEELKDLHISYCQIIEVPENFWDKPALETVYAHDTSLPGAVPPVLLSQNSYGDNCLHRLRAYYRSLRQGKPVTVRDTKLMLLGNGRVGKTKLRHRLVDNDWDESDESTHGIHIAETKLSAGPGGAPAATPLKIWDFGGQDIYIGTHALFLRTRAIFSILWTHDSEPDVAPIHIWNGIEHRNFPLSYWVRYVAQTTGKDSPLLLIQSQCDTEADCKHEPPVVSDLLETFDFKPRDIRYSARKDRGRGGLTEALHHAIEALDARRPDLFPESWVAVKTAVENLSRMDKDKVSHEREYRTMSFQDFTDICASYDDLKDEEAVRALLLVLHDQGTVYWRPGWFEDLIILDQQWALGAIYAVLERDTGLFHYLRDERKGRFTRDELDVMLWGKPREENGVELAPYSVDEQEMFIQMMRSVGICFELRAPHEIDGFKTPAVYLAPDLLPERDGIAGVLANGWDDNLGSLEITFIYDFMPPGLLRTIMAELGNAARDAADYWINGFYLYDGATKARLLVEQDAKDDWKGHLILRAQKGDARELLARIAAMVVEQNERLHLTPADIKPPPGLTMEELQERAKQPHSGYRLEGRTGPAGLAEAVRDKEKTEIDDDDERSPEVRAPVEAEIERGADKACYISYKHADETEDGRVRGAAFEAVKHHLAENCKLNPQYDVINLGPNDSIDDYKNIIARSERVVMVISAKYLESDNCLAEMFALHEHCLKDKDEWRRRVRVVRTPCAHIESEHWGSCADFWREKHGTIDEKLKQHGLEVSQAEIELGKRYKIYAERLPNILQLIVDALHPCQMDEISQISFEVPGDEE